MSEDNFHLGIKALIRNDRGQVLPLQVNPAKLRGQHGAYWDLPGGRVQKGDTVLDTLKRELAEETGINDIHSTKEVGMVLSNVRIPLNDDETVGLILGIYECSVANGAVIAISDEHIAFQWFTPKEAAILLGTKYPEHFCALVADLA